MPDNPNSESQSPENPEQNSASPDVPASVTFMEIMRQAAAKKATSEPTAADQLFSRVIEPPRRPNPQSAPPAQPVTAEVRVETQPPAHPELRDAALEEQRVRRVKRRRARRRQQTVGVLGGIIRSLLVVTIAAGLMATIFTWWTPSQFISDNVKNELSIAQATSQPTPIPTILPTPNWLRRVGIVSGHRGPQVPPDPGAICPDGLTEASINFAVAQKVVHNLQERGYSVDLLDEFDPRLTNYQAAALVSIHTNTCENFGEIVSGFLVASAAARRSSSGNDQVLVDCLAQNYAQATGLQRRDGLTIDMTDYHTFREIHALTPAAIIELGFLLGDRDTLTNKQDAMAQGITNGILCFLEPSKSPALATPTGQSS